MVNLMVGRNWKVSSSEGAAEEGYFAIDNLRLRATRNMRFRSRLARANPRLAGLVGAGRTEVAEALFGVNPGDANIRLDNKPLRVRSARDAISWRVYLIPEDRRQAGLITEDVIRQNITLPARRYSTGACARPRDPCGYRDL